jgi:hypothetical protein
MTLIAHVDTSGIRMYNFQSRIGCVQSLLQFFALLAIHLSALQTLKCGHLSLRHGILSLLVGLPGSAQLAATTQTLRRGRAWPFQANLPPNNESLQLKSCSLAGTKAPRC